MLSLFSSLKGLISTRKICIDGPVFRIQTRLTVLVLLSASLLLTLRQHFGDPIYCIFPDEKKLRIIESFCWIHATFILPHAWNATIGKEIPYPGIDRHVPGDEKVYQGYYQWVSLVLLLQGIFFYLPRYFWKVWEKGTMSTLKLNLDAPLLCEDDVNKSCDLLACSIQQHWGNYGSYFKCYIFCEILAFANVAGQMWLLDEFFDGSFTTLGTKVIQYSEWNQEYRKDPLVRAFPRVTKCQFHDFGPSGDVQKLDSLCLLPLNVLNEKIFIFLWFWLVFLCALSLAVLLYRALLIAFPVLRYTVFLFTVPRMNKNVLDKLLNKASMSDWFCLYLLAQNIEHTHFRTVVYKLANIMELNNHIVMPSAPESEKLAYV